MQLLRVSVAHGLFMNCVISAFLYLSVTIAGGILGRCRRLLRIPNRNRTQGVGLVAAGFLPLFMTPWTIPAVWVAMSVLDGWSRYFLPVVIADRSHYRKIHRHHRNYGSQGILQRLSGILLSRPMRYTHDMTQSLFAHVRRVLAEFGREDMPVVANMDFGHTSPQMVVPIGCRAIIDPKARRVAILEATVT